MAFQSEVTDRLNQLFYTYEVRRMCIHPSDACVYKALKRRVNTGEVVEPLRGIYARTAYWNALSRPEKMQHVVRTLSDMHPNWVFANSTAAIVHNLDVPNSVYYPMHYLVGVDEARSKNPYLKPHNVKEPIGQQKNGANITSVEKTVVDCSTNYEFPEALAIADSALHQGLTTKARLLSHIDDRANRRGVRKARRVISHADSRPDSGGESIVRGVMIENNLPEPELQAQVEDLEHPGKYYRVDFMFTRPDGKRVAMELDGKDKYTNLAMTKGQNSIQVMMKERQREAAITAHGIEVVRFAFNDAVNPKVLLPRLAKYGIMPVK